MVDVVDKITRSRMMAGIRGHDTKPEIAVRKFLHGAGFRFRLSPSNLIGKPDIVLPKYKAVVFVHGCYWHRHSGCIYATTPKTNVKFWINKFDSNVERDKTVISHLKKDGWKVIVIWGCHIDNKHLIAIRNRISANLQ